MSRDGVVRGEVFAVLEIDAGRVDADGVHAAGCEGVDEFDAEGGEVGVPVFEAWKGVGADEDARVEGGGDAAPALNVARGDARCAGDGRVEDGAGAEEVMEGASGDVLRALGVVIWAVGVGAEMYGGAEGAEGYVVAGVE